MYSLVTLGHKSIIVDIYKKLTHFKNNKHKNSKKVFVGKMFDVLMF